jgi:hypothetical protein
VLSRFASSSRDASSSSPGESHQYRCSCAAASPRGLFPAGVSNLVLCHQSMVGTAEGPAHSRLRLTVWHAELVVVSSLCDSFMQLYSCQCWK